MRYTPTFNKSNSMLSRDRLKTILNDNGKLIMYIF